MTSGGAADGMSTTTGGSKGLKVGAAVLAAPFVLGVGVATLVGGGALTPKLDPAAAVIGCGPVLQGQTEPLAGVITPDMDANAGIAYAVAKARGLPDAAALVAITAGLTESGLHNLNYGDRDSLGVWQERPSEGWGTPEQVMDVAYAAGRFYDHLQAVANWTALPPDVAAQAVERSGFPERYAQFVPLATRWVATLAGTASCNPTDGWTGGTLSPGDGGLPAGFALPPTTPARAVPAIQFAAAQLGKPYLYGGTGPDSWDCSGLMQAAYAAAGIGVPRVTSTQVQAGTPVYDQAQMLPGDLVFIAGDDGTDAVPGHDGMYLGSGLVLHAPYTGQHVRVDPIAGWPIVAVRRYA